MSASARFTILCELTLIVAAIMISENILFAGDGKKRTADVDTDKLELNFIFRLRASVRVRVGVGVRVSISIYLGSVYSHLRKCE